jgi:signal transduction histidine kinase
LKYLRPQVPGHIDIAAAVSASKAIFSVADNGRGIDPEDRGRIFDLFRRAGIQDQPGEGIGLAHVRALVRRLGGSIAVDSRLGQGAVFTVVLPLAAERGWP